MREHFTRWLIAACCMISATLEPIAATAVAPPGCVAPKTLHVTAISLWAADPPVPDEGAVAARLKREDFDEVGKSLPGTFSDMGWFAVSQLAGTNYSPVLSLAPGATTTIGESFHRDFLHVAEIRLEMPCDAALAQHPDDVFARNARGDWELRNGALKAAITDYTAALAIKPDFTSAFYGRASAYYRLGAFEKAATDAGEVRAGIGYSLRAWAEIALGEYDLAAYDATRGGDPLALGTAYSSLGYFAAAIDQFDLALKSQPGEIWALGGRGFAYFSIGDLALAGDDLGAVAHARPQTGRPYIALAILRYARGDLPAALAAARRARALAPGEPYAALWIQIAGRQLRGVPKPLAKGRCEADFYAATYRLQIGQTAAARRLLRSAADECPYKELERAAALALLRRP